MANKYSGEVSIRLDRVRILKFTHAAMIEFEDATGQTVPEVLAELTKIKSGNVVDLKQILKIISDKKIRALLWSALIEEDPDLTMKNAGKLLDHAEGESYQDRLLGVIVRVLTAWGLFAGDDEGKKKAHAMLAKMEEYLAQAKVATEKASRLPKASTGQNSNGSHTDSLASSPVSSGA